MPPLHPLAEKLKQMNACLSAVRWLNDTARIEGWTEDDIWLAYQACPCVSWKWWLLAALTYDQFGFQRSQIAPEILKINCTSQLPQAKLEEWWKTYWNPDPAVQENV